MAKTRLDSQEHSDVSQNMIEQTNNFPETPYHSCAFMLSTNDIYIDNFHQFSKHTVRGRFLPLHDQTCPTTTWAYSFKHFLNQLPNFRYQSSYNSQHIFCPVCFCEPQAKLPKFVVGILLLSEPSLPLAHRAIFSHESFMIISSKKLWEHFDDDLMNKILNNCKHYVPAYHRCHLSNEKNLKILGYIGDEILPGYNPGLS